MRVKALKNFISTTYGNVDAGQVLEVSDSQGRHLNAHGLTGPVEYETKVIREVPTVPGAEKPSSSSPAAPVSSKTMPVEPDRRGGSSRSTAPSGSAGKRTRSTRATTSGGRTTGRTGKGSKA